VEGKDEKDSCHFSPAMKKLILLLFLVPIVHASFLNISLECESSQCVQGRTTAWNFTVSNYGEQTIKILSYRLVDAVKQNTYISQEWEYPVEVVADSNVVFSIRESVPNPSRKDELIVYPCFTIQPAQESWGTVGKEVSHCYDDINFTFTLTECLENTDCKDDHICTEQRCEKIECSYCQYAQYYQCMDYGCCKNDECPGSQRCEQNSCVDLKCKEDEYIINHTCTATACMPEEIVANFTCIPADCADDEHLANHECRKVECAYNEKASNHSCLLLNCSETETPSDHECIALDCADNEDFVDHKCLALSCGFFRAAEGHECRINSAYVLFVFMTIMIIFLIIVDYRKYRYVQKKKIIQKFFGK